MLIREGRYPQTPPLPFVPGSEIAGDTDDGRRVLAFVRSDGGGYAEQAVADEDWLFELPDEATYEQGAAFLLAFLTAWIPFTRQTRVESGTRVLVTAAAGGVGSAGVQVARALGAEVVGAVGSSEKLDHVRALGADAVTYEEVGELEPFDVILDQVGGELFARVSSCFARSARSSGSASPSGAVATASTPRSSSGRNVDGGGLLPRALHEAPPRSGPRGRLRAARALVGGRDRTGRSGATFPLAEADDALRLVAERRSTGKVVLVP